MKPYPFQVRDQEILKANNYRALLNMQTGSGKAQPLTAKVLTPSGFVRMGDVRVGSTVVVPSGGVARVGGVFPQGVRDVYRVTFRDGRQVEADGEHLWTVRAPRFSSPKVYVKTTAELMADLEYTNGVSKWAVDPVTPMDLGRWGSTIPPYILGLLLGDGSLGYGSLQYSTSDPELLEAIRARYPDHKFTFDGRYTHRITNPKCPNALLDELTRLGLRVTSAYKHVPTELLNSEVGSRYALLQGLLDTDGTPNRNAADWISASEQLAHDVTFLVRSLGGEATQSDKWVRLSGWDAPRKYHRVRIKLPNAFPPFRLPRKRDKVVVASKYSLTYHKIRKIEHVRQEDVQCIYVEHPDHEYVTDHFTRTHNTAAGAFAVKESGASLTLVVAPDNTHRTAWEPTIGAVTGNEARIVGNGRRAHQKALADLQWGVPGVYLMTPQFFTRSDVVNEISGDLLIVDEAHLLATPKSKGQRRLSGYDRRDTPARDRFDGRLALSGTSLRNKFDLAWSHSRFLWPELFRRGDISYDNFVMWQSDRMDYEEVITGMSWVAPWDPSTPRPEYVKRIDGELWEGVATKVKQYHGETDPGRWIAEAPCVITHYKRERCCEFHPDGFLDLDAPQVIHETIELSPAQKRAVKELDQHMMTWLDDNPLVTEIPLTKAQRIREMILGVPTVTYDADENMTVEFAPDCESPFLDRLQYRLQNDLEDENVVVYLSSAKFARVTVDRLNKAGVPTMEFSGATRTTRDALLAEFGTKYRVLVGTIEAVGTGTDGIQRVASTEVWMNRSTDETANTQAEGRTDRMGQRRQVQRIYLEDDLGLHDGRMSEQVQKRLRLAKSLQRA